MVGPRTGTVRISLDLFPQTVRLPTGVQFSPVRVVVVDDVVQLYRTSPNSNLIEMFWERALLSSSGSRLGGYELTTEDGPVMLSRAGGCGCGNPLKTYDPFPEARKVAASL